MTKVEKMEVFACISCRDRSCAYAYMYVRVSRVAATIPRETVHTYDEGERGRESMEEAKKGSETR